MKVVTGWERIPASCPSPPVTTLAPAAPQGAERHRHRQKHRLQPTLVPECREDRRMHSFLCTWQQSLPFHAFGPQDVQTPWVPASYPPSGWSSSDSLYVFPLYPLANCRPLHHSVYTLTRIRTCPWINVCTHLRTCPHIQVSTWLCTQVYVCVYTQMHGQRHSVHAIFSSTNGIMLSILLSSFTVFSTMKFSSHYCL